MVYRALVGGRSWFPDAIEGRTVVLRRHVAANLEAYRRWYLDPEVAYFARYQNGPMREDEVDRFFQARALGPEALSMAIHVRADDRLIGTCAFSQLDGDHGSALYHITIGEKDAWGHGYGTEATELMLDHAFGALRLHRVALGVFEFNERAIRAYAACGFVIEGRAREAIFRGGRWWDELSMSVLASEWRRRKGLPEATDAGTGTSRGASEGEAGRWAGSRTGARRHAVDRAGSRSHIASRLLGR